MDFRRLDQNTVQCILSEEEMHAYGFQIEDFFSDQEKARNFLEQLVEMAEEEVGYESKGGMISMQIMKMPNNDLAITFSERDPGESFQGILQHLHQQLTGLLGADADIQSEEGDSSGYVASGEESAATDMEYQERLKEVAKKKRKQEKQQFLAPKAYRFETLHALEQFAASVDIEKPITSTAYKDVSDDSYYLLLKKGRLRMDEYIMLSEKILEFATLASSQPYVEQFCKEHFEVFIPKQAIQVLRKIETGK